jgi:tRNA 2-thiouridine synthesizing protein A
MTATPEELSRIAADKQVDARGMACPGPLLEAKREITSISVGGVMEVLSSDQSTNKDIPRWSKKIGHEYLGTIEEPGYWRIFVKRGK